MPIYLDNNATTLLDPEVAEHMRQLMERRLANPSSQHQAGRQARQVIEQARDSILLQCHARVSGMQSDQLIFTSGGTESNNLAISGLAADRPGAIVVSGIEHPSVLGAAEFAASQGREVRYLPCDRNGIGRIDVLEEWLSNHEASPIALVSWMLANNETGVLQPVARAAQLCRQRDVLMHTDAVQALGKIPVHFQQLNVDAMSITAHKLHGPIGVGGLILRHGIALRPMIFGGFQQLGQRPGTESPLLASGFDKAIQLALRSREEESPRMQQLRERLEQSIGKRLPFAVEIGQSAQRLPHTLSVAFPGLDRQAIQLALDQAGIACSTGSACASGSSQPSHVLMAMGLEQGVVQGAIRFSLSRETTEAEIDAAIEIIEHTILRLMAFSKNTF